MLVMRKRKQTRPPTAAKLVKTMARARVGAVPPGSSVPDQRRKPDKHKRDLRRQADAE
ncbi:MAG: hypothetical protein ACRD1F_00030 [Terriglobales bacterium]